MRVLLVDPPWVVESEGNLWKSVRSCLPSLGLATIAACLELDGHDVAILDCTAEDLSVEGADRWMADVSPPPDCVGISATCATFDAALLLAARARKRFPSARIVMGGVHPTVDPEGALSCPAVDAVVLGEGERTMAEVVRGVPFGEIAGLAYRHNGEILRTPPREPITDLDSLPLPAYHLLPMKKYHPAVGSFRKLPAMSLFATRGCPGRCTFCYRIFGGKIRKRSARHIASEIRLLHDRYGIREIAFYDDTFTIFGEEVERLCRILIDEGPRISWSCFTRVDRVDADLLRLMKKAGCHMILFGVESADPEILKTIRKGISLEDAVRAVRLAREVGIRTRVSFMFGNPGETQETVNATIRFAKELDPDQVQFNLTTAYPGTELYDWAKQNGCLATDRAVGWNMSDHNLRLPTISPEALSNAYRRAHAEFYLRPRIVVRRLAAVRTWSQARQEFKGAVAVMRARFRRQTG